MNDDSVSPPQRELAVPPRWRLSAALLVTVALFAALYLARTVLLPIALALVLSFLLGPLLQTLQRLRVPRALAAGIIVAGLIFFLSLIATLLAAPAQQWVERAPELTERIEQRLSVYSQLFRKFSHATEQVEALAQAGTRDEEVSVKVRGPGLRGLIIASTWELIAGAAILIFLLYFLLASGDTFLRRVVRVLPRFQSKRIAVNVVRRIRIDVTRYLFTVTLINIGLGIAVAFAMALLGMPNPALWGVLATVLNFIPYLGPTVTLTIIAAVALLTFDSATSALLRPLTYLVITTLEGQLLTPFILGRRLMLHPVVVFISLIFWAWLWGIPGALLAVPLTMIIKIVCDAVPPLAPIGVFMAR